MIPVEVLVETPDGKLEYRGIHPHIIFALQIKALIELGYRMIRFRFATSRGSQ